MGCDSDLRLFWELDLLVWICLRGGFMDIIGGIGERYGMIGFDFLVYSWMN